MKQIENIFSKSITSSDKIPCPNPKIPIIIDTREKQSMISANLIEQKANIKFKKLEIGDYLINDIIIERKTFSDFVNSMLDKRLFTQLKEIKKYPKYLLILEGFDYKYNKFNVHENAIKGMIISITTGYQIPIIYTKNEKDTSKFLILIARKKEKFKQENPLRQSKNFKTSEERKQFILEGFPGIGPTSAKQLLKKFKSLKNIFQATKEELAKIDQFTKNKIKKFQEILDL